MPVDKFGRNGIEQHQFISPMFATVWPGFHRFSSGPSLITFFNGSPASGWTRNFRVDYIQLPVFNFIIVTII